MNFISEIKAYFNVTKVIMAFYKEEEIKELTVATLDSTLDLYGDKAMGKFVKGITEGFFQWASNPENAIKVRNIYLNAISNLAEIFMTNGNKLNDMTKTWKPVTELVSGEELQKIFAELPGDPSAWSAEDLARVKEGLAKLNMKNE